MLEHLIRILLATLTGGTAASFLFSVTPRNVRSSTEHAAMLSVSNRVHLCEIASVRYDLP
jgi:hypothetical protein